MRAPNPKTLSATIAKAEAFRPCAGTALYLTPAEARALIYETSAKQAAVHYDGNVPSRCCSVVDAWEVVGYPDVLGVTGWWDTNPITRPHGPVFVVCISRGAILYAVDIITPALQAPKVEG